MRILTIIIERQGFAVTQAESGDAAINILELGGKFNTIITDESMPGHVQGQDLIEYIKGNSPNTPVILMSGLAMSTKYEDRDNVGRVVSTMKPVRSNELLQILANVLELKEIPG